MNDQNKTKAQLIEELTTLRQREAEHQRTEQVQTALYRIVSDIPRRRANQAIHGRSIHIFAHIQGDEGHKVQL